MIDTIKFMATIVFILLCVMMTANWVANTFGLVWAFVVLLAFVLITEKLTQ